MESASIFPGQKVRGGFWPVLLFLPGRSQHVRCPLRPAEKQASRHIEQMAGDPARVGRGQEGTDISKIVRVTESARAVTGVMDSASSEVS